MIRKACPADIPAIAESYRALLVYEERHGSHSNWKRNVYPTAAVPESKIPEGSMYVLEEDGRLRASMVLNHDQADEYAGIRWRFPGEGERVLVIHTLCIPPREAGHGYGRRMVAYAKRLAAELGCTAIRIDTYAHNEPAKALYLKCGFQIAGYGTMVLQGLIEEEQVYLEYEVKP